MNKIKFTQEQKSEIVTFAKEHGEHAAAKKYEPSVTTIKRWVAESNKQEELAESIKILVLEKRVAFLEMKQADLIRIIDDLDTFIDARQKANSALEKKCNQETIVDKIKRLLDL